MAPSDEMVSIVMPAYQAEGTIGASIDSVLAQTHASWELLVVDDRSMDGTRAIAAGYAERDPRIILLSNEGPGGAAAARNVGIKRASGRFLAFLDSDDLWDADFLERQLAFARGSGAALTTASYRRMNDDLRLELYEPYIVPKIITYERTLYSCALSCLTTLVDLSVTGKRYMPLEAGKREDLGFFLDILKAKGPALGNPEILATYRIRGNSVSRNKLKMMGYQWIVYRRIEKFGILKSGLLVAKWIVAGLRKYS